MSESPTTSRGAATVEIAAPIEAVWEVTSDPIGYPRWVEGLSDVRPAGSDDAAADRTPVAAAGSVYDARFRFAGVSRGFAFQLAAWDPPHRFAIVAIGGPVPFETVVTLEPIDGGTTRVTKSIATPGSRLASMVAGALAPVVERRVVREVEALRALIEGDGAGEAP